MYWGPGAVAAIPAAALAALLPCRGLSLRFTRRAARQPVTPPSREVRPRVPCVGPDASHRRGSRSHPDRRTVVDSVIAPGWSYPLCACSEFAPAHRPLRVRPHWRRATPTVAEPVRRLRASARTYGKRWIKCSNQNLDEAARSNAASGRPCIRYHGIITSGGAADSRGLRSRCAEDCAVVAGG